MSGLHLRWQVCTALGLDPPQSVLGCPSTLRQVTLLCCVPSPQVTLHPDQISLCQTGQSGELQLSSEAGLDPGQFSSAINILVAFLSETHCTVLVRSPPLQGMGHPTQLEVSHLAGHA